jgi:hypothetical protein
MFKEEGDYTLREIHEGICGSHSGARVLAHKVLNAGFYWLNKVILEVPLLSILSPSKNDVAIKITI